MIQLNAIIIREITQRHKYRWHVANENYYFPNTFDYNYYVYSNYLVCSVTVIAHIIRY